MLRRQSDITHLSSPDRSEIRRMLIERQRHLLNEIHDRVRDVREEGLSSARHVVEPGEPVPSEPENDLAFALIQMKSETLERIREALRRLDAGTYGVCIDCDEGIATVRLRALPFAVRCRDCQQALEDDRDRKRHSLLAPSAGPTHVVDTLV